VKLDTFASPVKDSANLHFLHEFTFFTFGAAAAVRAARLVRVRPASVGR
jgi:hypothetical protein